MSLRRGSIPSRATSCGAPCGNCAASSASRSSRHVLSFPRGEEVVKALSAAGLRATERAERVQALVENPRDAVDFIAAHRGIIEDFEFVQGDMDDVFLALTGKELRES